ncbi:hypothetical protein [Streptomyces sp. NPDC088789]|uniref:hypothetical protein n=1 Tax=Streptomyces sp. NPDC088789 TaxID=3365899 RepID=UPI0037F7327A
MAGTDENAVTAADDALYVLTAVLLTPAQFPSVLGDDYPDACATLGLAPLADGYGLVLGQDGEGARWTVATDDVSLVAVAVAAWDCGMEYDLSPDERSVVAALPGWPLAVAVAAPGIPAPHDPGPEIAGGPPLSPPDTSVWGPAQRRLGADEIALQWTMWREQIDDADFLAPGGTATAPGPSVGSREGEEQGERTAEAVGAVGAVASAGGVAEAAGGAAEAAGGAVEAVEVASEGGGTAGASAGLAAAGEVVETWWQTEPYDATAGQWPGSGGSGGPNNPGTPGTRSRPSGPSTPSAPSAPGIPSPPGEPGAQNGALRPGHSGIRRVLAEAAAYVDTPPPLGRVRSSFAPGDARTLRADGPGWSLVARTDDIAFVLLDDEPGEVLPVGRGPELPGLLAALDRMAVRPI